MFGELVSIWCKQRYSIQPRYYGSQVQGSSIRPINTIKFLFLLILTMWNVYVEITLHYIINSKITWQGIWPSESIYWVHRSVLGTKSLREVKLEMHPSWRTDIAILAIPWLDSWRGPASHAIVTYKVCVLMYEGGQQATLLQLTRCVF